MGGSHGWRGLTHVAMLHVDGLHVCSRIVESLSRCEYCRVASVAHHVLLLMRTIGLVDHLDLLLGRIVQHLRIGVTRLEGRSSSSIGQWIGDGGARSDCKLLTSL